MSAKTAKQWGRVWNEEESLVGPEKIPEKLLISAQQAGALYDFPALALSGSDKNSFILASVGFTIHTNFTIHLLISRNLEKMGFLSVLSL